jgi:hypothetical protein
MRFTFVDINGAQSTRLSFDGKTCASCKRLLPLTDFYRRGTGHHSYCKLCHRDRTMELRARAVRP